MRIAPINGKQGLNFDRSDDDIQSIEARVQEFRESLITQIDFSKNKEYKKAVKQIDKYWYQLFCDPITVQTHLGSVKIQPQRTNNLLERFFRDFKRGYRKKSGNNSMGRMLQSILADTPLIKNLQNTLYMELLLDGKSSLEELFATIEHHEVNKIMKKSQESENKIPKKIKKMIARPNFPDNICNILLSN